MKRFAFLAMLLVSVGVVPAQQFASVPGQGRSMVVSKLGIARLRSFLPRRRARTSWNKAGTQLTRPSQPMPSWALSSRYVNGIGGDLFMVYYEARTGKLYGLTRAGGHQKLSPIDALRSKGVTSINPIGVETIDVPGAVAGWDAMRPFRHAALQSDPCAGNLLRAEWVSARRAQHPLLGCETASRSAWLQRNLCDLAQSSEARRPVHESRAGQLSSADRRSWPRRLLRRSYDGNHGEVPQRKWGAP